MKIAIRTGVFETNSSSVHAFVMMNSALYDTWQKTKGFLYFGDDEVPAIAYSELVIQDPEIITQEEAEDIIREHAREMGLSEEIANVDEYERAPLFVNAIPYDFEEDGIWNTIHEVYRHGDNVLVELEYSLETASTR